VSAPRFAVILAGGVGSRFWPLSTPARPKQLLPLVTERTMLEDTVARLEPMVAADQLLILTSQSLAPAVRELLPQLGADQVLAEPRAAGTAAALTWASLEVRRRSGPDAVLVSVHADSAVADEAAFRATLTAAADAAEHERALCLVGIVPTEPHPGLGYIEPGAEIAGGVRRVTRFIEKPDRAAAAALVRAGCLWNSGIFAWRVEDFLAEVRAHTPELSAALEAGATAAGFFGAVRGTPSVDVAVLERSGRVVVVPGAFGWSDVGTWGSLRAVRRLDAAGNAVHGAAELVDARNNVVHAAAGRVVLYGVSDLVVVAREGVTLVTTVEQSADLKALLDALPAAVVAAP
jgi:mannose-1-phosphate guanylyltransferase